MPPTIDRITVPKFLDHLRKKDVKAEYVTAIERFLAALERIGCVIYGGTGTQRPMMHVKHDRLNGEVLCMLGVDGKLELTGRQQLSFNEQMRDLFKWCTRPTLTHLQPTWTVDEWIGYSAVIVGIVASCVIASCRS